MKKQKLRGRGEKQLPLSASKETSNGIFPWYYPYVIFTASLILRIYYVSQRKNWWILHPDEIFQSLEVAHSEVYGYGFRPYEYLTSTLHPNDTRLRQKEISLGMAAMRSFIYPAFFIFVSWLVEISTLNIQPFMAWKISHSLVASFLPLAVHEFTKSLFQSHDVGILAAAFVVTSVHLNVFGTHTLVNSFLAPFVFFALSILINAVKKSGNNRFPEDSKVQTKQSSKNVDINKTSIDSAFHSRNSQFHYEIIPNGIHGLKKTNEKVPSVIEIVFWLPRLQLFMSAFPTAIKDLKIVVASFVLTTSCYIRPDLALFCFLILLPFTIYTRDFLKQYVNLSLGVLFAVLMCVWCDFKSYGYGILTPWNWFHFNILTDHPASLFGSMSLSFYTKIIFWENNYLNMIMLILVVILLTYMKASSKLKECENFVKLLVSFGFLLVIYSLQSHKEPRHIHNLFCSFFILISWIIISFCKSVLTVSQSRIFVCALNVLCAIGTLSSFPSPKDQSNTSWVYGQVYDSNDVNVCLEFVGQSYDATGVFLDKSIHMTGGYSILHKNIPILALLINEFNEFDNESRTVLKTDDLWSSGYVSVSTFSRVSNFITVSNSPYLLKYLINRPKYNYVILKENRRFVKYGFKEVFRSGKVKLLKRTFDAQEEEKLLITADKIPIGSNATILNYEGLVLFDLGCKKKAIERLETSLKLDPSITSNYQYLSNLYYDTGRLRKANSIMLRCFEQHNKDMCMGS